MCGGRRAAGGELVHVLAGWRSQQIGLVKTFVKDFFLNHNLLYALYSLAWFVSTIKVVVDRQHTTCYFFFFFFFFLLVPHVPWHLLSIDSCNVYAESVVVVVDFGSMEEHLPRVAIEPETHGTVDLEDAVTKRTRKLPLLS